ncbi:MAG TPA: PDZ domain-containing protein [Candidatus Methylomirabilis sp.]
MLDQLHYRYKVVERVVHADPMLVSIEGSRAVLEVEVPYSRAPVMVAPSEVTTPSAPYPTPPPRAALDAGLLGHVRVKEASPGIYDVNASDMQSVLDNAGRVLADLSPMVQLIISVKTGLQYRITSAASDGVISRQGFTVTAPKLAERAGIEIGDTILSVNGRPVDGLGSLYRIYREVRRDSALTTVQMELERQGTRLTKTYRIR